MPTYPPPVPLNELQRYLKDSSTDMNVTGLMTAAIDVATELIYTYLGRDFTAGALKTDIFFGDDRKYHFLHNPAGVISSWKYYDDAGIETDVGVGFLKIFANGKLVVSKEKTFLSGYEHRIAYTQPAMTCPEAVRQVIIEIAAAIFEESKQGSARFEIAEEGAVRYAPLIERHKSLLAPYRKLQV